MLIGWLRPTHRVHAGKVVIEPEQPAACAYPIDRGLSILLSLSLCVSVCAVSMSGAAGPACWRGRSLDSRYEAPNGSPNS